MTAPKITTIDTFGSTTTTIRGSWGKATIEKFPSGLALSWKMNARTARRWPLTFRESLISFPGSVDVFIPAPILQDISPILLECQRQDCV